MGRKSKIEWCDATWNPVVGCSPVSAGCDNCYAQRMAHRLRRNPATPQFAGLTGPDGRWLGQARLAQGHLNDPLTWRKPRRIFVCSMGDLFHESLDKVFVDNVVARVVMAPRHQYLLLTKRPERMRDYFLSEETPRRLPRVSGLLSRLYPEATPDLPWPLPNVTLMTSIEDQPSTDARLPPLVECGARGWRIGVSAEPLLGPVDLAPWVTWPARERKELGRSIDYALAMGGSEPDDDFALALPPRLSWVIAGGETGPCARPMHPDWPRTLRDRCAENGIPFFFKRWGEWVPASAQGKLLSDDANIPSGFEAARFDWTDGGRAYRVGKSRSGRLLDGVEHNEIPEGM